MKTNISGKQHPTHSQAKPIKKPENKDNLDSRESEEQSGKGDDVTHNNKEHHGALKSKNKKYFITAWLMNIVKHQTGKL